MTDEKLIPDPLFEVGDMLCAEYIDLSGNPQKVAGKCTAITWNKGQAQHFYEITPKGFASLAMKFPEKGSWQTSSFPVYRDMASRPEINPGNPSYMTTKPVREGRKKI